MCRICIRLHGTFIVQYIKEHHIVVHCSVVVTYKALNIWIKIICIANQIECLHGTKLLYPHSYLDRDHHPDNFVPCNERPRTH